MGADKKNEQRRKNAEQDAAGIVAKVLETLGRSEDAARSMIA